MKGPPAHVAEGFGRFAPADFARFVVMARASLLESQNHLIDAVDRGYIAQQRRVELNVLAEAALEEVTGLLDYLNSPEALRNARRARERRILSRGERLAKRSIRKPRTPNPEPRTPNSEPNPAPEPEHEPSTENQEE